MNVNFYLHQSKAIKPTSIMLHVAHQKNKLIYSTGQKALPSDWNKGKQRLKSSSGQAVILNTLLTKIEDEVLNCFRTGILEDNFDFKQSIRNHLDSVIRGVSKEPVEEEKQIEDFLTYLDLMIKESREGKRVLRNGRRLAEDTYRSYSTLKFHLTNFQEINRTTVQLKRHQANTTQEKKEFNRYWKEWYNEFTNYMYDTCGLFDNAVGNIMKTFKTLWNYVRDDKCQDIGNYQRLFHSTKENIQVIALSKDKLNRLINDKEVYDSLPNYLKVARDCFLFGCSVGLRIKDLKTLSEENLLRLNGDLYLYNVSSKTNTETTLKLPQYCIEIIDKYMEVGKPLLPICSVQKFNNYIKEVCKQYGFDEEVSKVRERRGIRVKVLSDENTGEQFKFYQLVTTHCMRRTFVTTMLEMNVPERIVKSLSGHSPNSRSFSQYVKYSQRQNDKAIDVAFNNLSNGTEG